MGENARDNRPTLQVYQKDDFVLHHMGWGGSLRPIPDHQMGETKKGPSERTAGHQVLVKGCGSPTNAVSVYVCVHKEYLPMYIVRSFFIL